MYPSIAQLVERLTVEDFVYRNRKSNGHRFDSGCSEPFCHLLPNPHHLTPHKLLSSYGLLFLSFYTATLLINFHEYQASNWNQDWCSNVAHEHSIFPEAPGSAFWRFLWQMSLKSTPPLNLDEQALIVLRAMASHAWVMKSAPIAFNTIPIMRHVLDNQRCMQCATRYYAHRVRQDEKSIIIHIHLVLPDPEWLNWMEGSGEEQRILL